MPAPTYTAALVRLAAADPEALAVVYETLMHALSGEDLRARRRDARDRRPVTDTDILLEACRAVDAMTGPLVVEGMWSRPALTMGDPTEFATTTERA